MVESGNPGLRAVGTTRRMEIKDIMLGTITLAGGTMMADDSEQKKFSQELESRFDALAQWAIENWPDHAHPLSMSDFSRCRLELSALGSASGPAKDKAPDPEHGGAQYVNVSPAPWP